MPEIRILEKGKLTVKNAGDEHYRMLLLDESYHDQVIRLQDEIVEEINDPVFYDPVTPENIKKRFQEEGRTIGTFAGDQLIGCRISHFPPAGGDNFGVDINLPAHELPYVAHLAATMVLSQHRGDELAYRMNLHALDIIKALGFRHICSTVFPTNIANIVTQFKTGLSIHALKEKYEGKLRYIFYRSIEKTKAQYAPGPVRISIHDIAGQKALLEKGFIGCAMDRASGDPEILYFKRLS